VVVVVLVTLVVVLDTDVVVVETVVVVVEVIEVVVVDMVVVVVLVMLVVVLEMVVVVVEMVVVVCRWGTNMNIDPTELARGHETEYRHFSRKSVRYCAWTSNIFNMGKELNPCSLLARYMQSIYNSQTLQNLESPSFTNKTVRPSLQKTH
jgi:hypothetical protein